MTARPPGQPTGPVLDTDTLAALRDHYRDRDRPLRLRDALSAIEDGHPVAELLAAQLNQHEEHEEHEEHAMHDDIDPAGGPAGGLAGGKAGGKAPPYLRVGDVARLFRVTPKTVSRWAKQGRLPCQRTIGGHYRFPPEAIRALRLRLTVTATDGAGAGEGR